MQIGYVYIRPVQALYVRALGPYKMAAASAWSNMLAWLDEHYEETPETDHVRAQILAHGLEPTRPSR